MKKIILGLVIVLLALMLVGCGAKESKTTVKRIEKSDTVPSPDEIDTSGDKPVVYEVPAEGEEAEPEVETEANETEEPEAEEAPADVGVTQEELDQLKADIEGMDVEDLGGLSE